MKEWILNQNHTYTHTRMTTPSDGENAEQLDSGSLLVGTRNCMVTLGDSLTGCSSDPTRTRNPSPRSPPKRKENHPQRLRAAVHSSSGPNRQEPETAQTSLDCRLAPRGPRAAGTKEKNEWLHGSAHTEF